METLKGWKTIIICVLALGFVVLDAGLGLGMLENDTRLVIIMAALASGGLRFVTTTPIGKK